ncbi:hypothetical protein DLM75_06885 [Leptospira stimsonii]|uniref:Uncharacterized protein n=1 Tax=Leptospira stimsonii TaxID=2202203 RepID=A0A396ZF48_9LEPT|nr:hypothetical protein DLM75_06885 [Leptospira stimsonii]
MKLSAFSLIRRTFNLLTEAASPVREAEPPRKSFFFFELSTWFLLETFAGTLHSFFSVRIPFYF